MTWHWIIQFVVMLILLAVLFYVVNALIPEPARKFFIVLVVVLGALTAIYMLLHMGRGGLIFPMNP